LLWHCCLQWDLSPAAVRWPAGDLIEACALARHRTVPGRPSSQPEGGYAMSWTIAIGIDTHRDRHSACALDRLGRPLGELEFATDIAGYETLWRWACSLGEPAFALEGSGSYGAGLARELAERRARVYECERPTRRDRRRG